MTREPLTYRIIVLVVSRIFHVSTLLHPLTVAYTTWVKKYVPIPSAGYSSPPNELLVWSSLVTHFLLLYGLDPLDCRQTIPVYECCPEGIQPFLISREQVAWPWCNLAVSQRRPYCPTVNSRSTAGLVNRQWDAVDWACVLCESRIHKSPNFQR
jgi:hypothetical protein